MKKTKMWPIGLDRYARHALGIIPGETYREPQAASFKLQATSLKLQALDKLTGIG